MSEPIVEWSAIALSDAIHAREVSCVEVMRSYLDQIDRLNPRVNALVALRDPDACLAEARAADDALARGDDRGWMHGFPQAPKDIAPVAGLVTTSGSPIHRDRVTTVDALPNARVRAAGAIFIGRSNTPEFGLGSNTYNPVYGLTRNAFDGSRIAGGSSGGAAVALALRMLPVADGSDMMGSLRNPAGYNNVYGFRPSFGRVPNWPVDDVFFAQFSTIGPMARSVADVARLLAVQAGPDARVPFSLRDPGLGFAVPLRAPRAGLRIGWLGDLDGRLAIEPEVLSLCRGALAVLRTIGCDVEATTMDFPAERLWDAWLTLRSASVAASHGMHFDDPDERALLKPEALWEIERGRGLSALDVQRASAERTAWYASFVDLFERFDVLALPSAQMLPYDSSLPWPATIDGRAMDTYHRWMEVVVPATMGGLPALCVPAGFSDSGLPIGLQLIGPARADRALLELGHAYEAACPWAGRRSPLLDASAN